ncbi:HAD family hydrolase [Nocardiopsis dassonvillei]|uniref:HAD family hydrolase n=1 Tax=Nocardiopsis dassonvillei TaxID=2014 RepID=UPI003F579CA6
MTELTFHPNDITHIVWDWNGTLLDDNHANLSAVNAVCAVYGREPVEIDHWRSIFRRPLIPLYEELLGRPLTTGEWARLEKIYDEDYLRHLPSCRLAQDVPDLLLDWAGTGRTQSLLSMASHDHVVPLIAERGLAAHFTRVDGRRYDTEVDSKAEHLVHHLEAQGVDPAGVVLIGDIDDDARAARAAGAHSILVSTGLMAPERLAATGSPVVESPAAAVRALCGR